MFIGGSCFPRVLVIEFEGKLCLHQAWRDTLGQQRGPAQPELYRPCGGGGEKIEATGLLLHSDIYHVSLTVIRLPKSPLSVPTGKLSQDPALYMEPFLYG